MTLQATHRTSAFDIEVQSINIISSAGNQVNIWPLIEKFRLNETLLLPITYGECWVLDGINLIDKIGMTGFDHIQFAFGNPGQPKLITKSFRIYNVVDRQRVSNGAQTYRLLFCSEELYLASQYSISKSFKGKKISDMVKDIAINTLKIPKDRLAIEETVGNYNMILPYMRPFEAINYISRKALTKYLPDFGLSFKDINLTKWRDVPKQKALDAIKMVNETGCTALHAMKECGATVSSYYKYRVV